MTAKTKNNVHYLGEKERLVTHSEYIELLRFLREDRTRLRKLEKFKFRMLAGIIIIALAIFAMFFTKEAIAQVRNPAFAAPIELISLKAPYHLNKQYLPQLYDWGNLMLSTANSDANLAAIYSLRDRRRRLKNFDQALNKYHFYFNFFSNRPKYRKPTRHYIVAPPMQELEKIGYIGGWSRVCQQYRKPRYSYGNAILKNLYTGEQRLTHSAVIMAHELGHMMGAQHDSSNCNVMHPNAAGCSAGNLLTFNSKAINQMQGCYTRLNYGRRLPVKITRCKLKH